jgi:hypothetical protein
MAISPLETRGVDRDGRRAIEATGVAVDPRTTE